MKPLAVGVTAAVVLAGPPLYMLVQAGSLTGATALFRGLIVMAACTVAASFLNGIIEDFARDTRRRTHGQVVHHPSESGSGGGQPGPGPRPPNS